ncbi:chorismate mutase [Nocardia callitridis]|uniref:chorismate mutase n=1 Tax=Nocardia callitridis TaxID=648753 RepID=UPI0031EE4B4B
MPPRAPDASLAVLVALLVARLDTADAVAAAKWSSARRDGVRPTIDDPAREAEVYDAMARLGGARALSESWLRQVFFGQIEASKVVQRGLMMRWRFDPAQAPTRPPDLAAVRPMIDRVNIEIVDQLAARRTELVAVDCRQRLARSVFDAFASGRVDPLHRAALVRAVATLCPVRG